MVDAGSDLLRSLTILRWDLDKTYLVSNFESLRGLLWIPFERAADKRSVPGVVALIKAVRRSADQRGLETSVCFVSASPPQIGRAIREKLEMDGIEYEEIRFKDQVHHLVRGHFDVLREQIGYKLSELLRSAGAAARRAEELLFGDDWESDPLIYSLYADVLAGTLGRDELEPWLASAGVHAHYRDAIFEAMRQRHPPRRVRAILILRARGRAAADLEAFGQRLLWFDNYFECALILHALGYLTAGGVVEVALASGLDLGELKASFDSVSSRWPWLSREHLAMARRRLAKAGLLDAALPGAAWPRAMVWMRTRLGRPPVKLPPNDAFPDYERLVSLWSHRGRKEGREVHDDQE